MSSVGSSVTCASDGAHQTGACGPTLLRFDELHPPLLRATGAAGWRFDHWAPLIRESTGAIHARQGRIPDGPLYLDGFGYRDTGALELLTAVFVPARR